MSASAACTACSFFQVCTEDVLKRNDACSESTEDWYKKVQNNEAEATAIISSNTLFDPGPNDLLVKESPELKPDGVLFFKWRETDVTIRQVIRNKDRAGIRVDGMIYNCGDIFARLTDGAVNVEDNYFVHDMAVAEDMMGVNLPSKVDMDTDSKLLKLTDTLVVEKDELSDVITSIDAEADFNPDFVRMFEIRHESYIFMTAWSCSVGSCHSSR